MRILVIGAVAAGTSAAAKARRNDDFAEIVIYEKDVDISYSGCGLPYYIGNEIEDVNLLRPRDAAFFKKKYNIDVMTSHEVLSIDKENQVVVVKNLKSGQIINDRYDKLVIATGATSFVPPISGASLPSVFTLRNVQDAIGIKKYIQENKPSRAVVAGSGFIGLELLENLTAQGVDVTVVEMANKITPNLDVDMATLLENDLKKAGVKILTSSMITKISEQNEGLRVELGDDALETDMVILSTGVKPNVKLAQEIGLTLGETGAIKVDSSMKTSDENIYACGDCVETFSAITGKAVYRPLGSTANKTGRIAGDSLTGGKLRYKGNLSTGIFKVFDKVVASTGLSEVEALSEGYDIEICHNIKPDKPLYSHGENMVIKAIADRETEQLLGVQIIGGNGVDKRIDVFATLITYGATVDELFHIDLAYAPPFSTTKDPVAYTGMILDNAINSNRKLITSSEIKNSNEDIQIIDARSTGDFEKKGSVENAVNMPHAKLREMIDGLDKGKKTVTYCNKGVTGNAAQNILLNRGFENVFNLSGGHQFYTKSKKVD